MGLQTRAQAVSTRAVAGTPHQLTKRFFPPTFCHLATGSSNTCWEEFFIIFLKWRIPAKWYYHKHSIKSLSCVKTLELLTSWLFESTEHDWEESAKHWQSINFFFHFPFHLSLCAHMIMKEIIHIEKILTSTRGLFLKKFNKVVFPLPMLPSTAIWKI